LVGVISQPSAILTLILPDEPKVRPRANMDLPSKAIFSRPQTLFHERLAHDSISSALVKEIGTTEITGFERQGPALDLPRLTVQGTPGSICARSGARFTPSRCTMAPEVSAARG